MAFEYQFEQLPEYLEILKQKLRIAVIHGGDNHQPGSVIYPTHNPRSTKTYEAVAYDIAQALKDLGFQSVSVVADDLHLATKLQEQSIHLAWLNTGGVQGYNPVCHTPAMLEMLGIPYIGHNPLNSSILDNKHAFKRELQGLGFSTSPFMIWHPAQGKFEPSRNQRFKQIFEHHQGAFVVKPVSGRASLHVHVVENAEQLTAAVAQIHQNTHNTALIEQYLAGREFCISVCGYVIYQQGELIKRAKPFTFSIFERVLEPDEQIFTSMDKRAITANRIRLLSDSEAMLKQQLIDLAQQIYWDFNLNTLIRLDLRCSSDGNLYILEANPKPDLKRPTADVTSLVAQGLSEHRMSYEDLIYSLISDRLDYLFTYHHQIIAHITELLD
jgi:D-alanine-D-alanine ligase